MVEEDDGGLRERKVGIRGGIVIGKAVAERDGGKRVNQMARRRRRRSKYACARSKK